MATERSNPLPPSDARPAGDFRHALTVADRMREYVLHIPAGWDGKRPLPLVISFHGGGGNAKLSAMATGWSDKSETEGFFVVYPEGVRPHPDRAATFLRNPPFWNVGAGIGYAEEINIDDDAFMAALFDDLFDRLPIDRDRIYSTGFSNGASMAMHLALRFPEHIAAVGAVAGHLWRRKPEFQLTRPISLLYIIGEADPLNPLAGGTVVSPWGKALYRPPISQTIETWATWLGCSLEPCVLSSFDSDGGQFHGSDSPRRDIHHVRFGPNEQGAEVEFIAIPDAGHVWPGGPDILIEKIAGKRTDRLNATAAIWSFFERH